MLGTAGSLFHFRDIILNGKPEAFFVFFGDVFCDYPLKQMLEYRQKWMRYLLMSVEVSQEQTKNYGQGVQSVLKRKVPCLAENLVFKIK